MKKLLSMVLVIALAATLFAGCSKATPSPSAGVNPTPTPVMKVPTYDENYNDIIKFNLYDEADYSTRWTNTSKEWMYENYHLVIENSLPAVTFTDLATENARETYNTALSNLFLAEATRPDYMPCLKASSTGENACFKELSEYLVDLNPYIEDGQILQDYVKWLWEDDAAYWENVKQAFEVDGKLYALPRREMLPVQNFLIYAENTLKSINYDWDDLPSTWDGFVELLTAFKQASADNVPFVANNVTLDGLLSFIASTYGLDFNMDFSWTTKNGEPLWTYYWDEYLQILTRANELAAAGLVYTDSKKTNCVVHFDMEDKSAGRKVAVQKWQRNAETGKSVASYTTSANAGIWASSGWATESTGWRVSDVMIAQEGKKYSMIGSSQIDYTWVAIGNRLGEEFALRICDMLAYSLTDEGYICYFHGKEGDPFADTVEEAGSYVYVTDPDTGEKKIRWCVADRFGGAQEDYDFWTSVDEHFGLFADDVELSEEMTGGPEGDLSEQYGITDTGFYPSRNNFKLGTIWYADITSYPMQMTVYWENEQMSKDKDQVDTLYAYADENNSYIYDGFYRTPTEALGGQEGQKIETKINNLKAIAKEFTIGFLGRERTSSDWSNYIKSLQDAGYNDVYEFYANVAYSFPTEKVDGVESQSTVNAKRS